MKDLKQAVAHLGDYETVFTVDVWDADTIDRDDHDFLVQGMRVLDLGAQRERSGVLARVGEDRGAWDSSQRGVALREPIEEVRQRSFLLGAVTGDDHLAAAPGDHDGGDYECDQ